jgi:hypothetical protein
VLSGAPIKRRIGSADPNSGPAPQGRAAWLRPVMAAPGSRCELSIRAVSGCSAEQPNSAVSDQRIRTLVRRHRVEPRGFVPLWQRRGVASGLAPRSCGTRGPYGYDTRGRTGPLARDSKGAQRARYNENSDAISESSSKTRRKNANVALSPTALK